MTARTARVLELAAVLAGALAVTIGAALACWAWLPGWGGLVLAMLAGGTTGLGCIPSMVRASDTLWP